MQDNNNLPEYKIVADYIVSPTDVIVIGSDVEQTYLTSVSPTTRIATLGDIQSLYCGSFENTTTLNSSGTTSSNLVTFDTVSVSKGISLVSGSQLTFANPGRYLINFLGQFAFTGGASNYNITVWWSLNGNIINNGASTFSTSSAQGAQTMANVEDIITVNAGDYIQFYWWSGAAGMALVATASGTNPTRPASPSVKLNIFNVG